MSKGKVILYSMVGCDYCQEIKTLLDESKVQYETRDIHQYEEEFEQVKEATEFDHVPQLVVVTNRNINYVCDFETLEEAVEQTKRLIR